MVTLFRSHSAADDMHDMHRSDDHVHGSDGNDQLRTWIWKAKAGDHEALGELIDVCHDYLLPVARQFIPLSLKSKYDPADLIQEAALDAHQSIAEFRGDTIQEFHGWLRRILINKSGGIRRRFEGTEKRDIDRELVVFSEELEGLARIVHRPTPSEMAIDVEQRAQLLRCIDRLPVHLKQAIQLRHREGLTFAEIGEQTNRSADAARKLWERAVDKLRKDVRGVGKPGD